MKWRIDINYEESQLQSTGDQEMELVPDNDGNIIEIWRPKINSPGNR